MRSANSALVDRRVVVTLLFAVLLVLLLMSLAMVGSEAGPAAGKDSARMGSLVLGADGGSSSCVGACNGGSGGDSIGGAGGTSFGGSSVPGIPGQAGAPGTAGLTGTPGTPGTSGTEANPSFSESSDSAQSQAASESKTDEFVPVTPGSQPLPQTAPRTCAAGDLLGLGSLLAPLADILKLLNLC